MTALTRRGCLALLAGATIAPAALAFELPGDSIYRLDTPLVDQDGRPFELASMRGSPVLVAMFYSSCQMVCPVIFASVAMTLAALAPPLRERVQVAMVTLDPARDTADVLKETAAQHGCGANWHLLRASEADTRRIAAVLGVQYRRLPSGEFSHSSAIELLDREGRIAARTGVLGEVDATFVAKLRAA